MDTRNTDLRTISRDDERRRRDEATANALQQQVDELRLHLREQATRQQRLEELARVSESQVGQVRLDLGEVRQEATRAAQLRQLDDQRLRQQISDILGRVDEPLRPLRTLQAQMTDVVEQVRAARDQVGQAQKQIDMLRMQIEGQRGELARQADSTRGLREQIEAAQTAQASQARELQKLADQQRLVEQEVRRRVATIEQALSNLDERIDEVASHRPQLEEGIRQTREEIRVFQPQIDALVQRDKHLDQHAARVQVQAEERDALMRQRVEEIREHLATDITELGRTIDENVASLHARIGEWEAAHQDLGAELSDLAVRATALDQRDDEIAAALTRSEERLVRLQLEQAQAAWQSLMERRQKDDA